MKKFKEQISEYISHIKLFKKNARIYLYSGFLIGISFSGFRLLYNLFLKELNFSEEIMGKRLAIFSLGSLVIAIPATLSAKKNKFSTIYMISLAILFLSWLSQAFFTNLIPLFSASLIGGMFMTYYSVAVAPFIMRNSTDKERTHLFSFNFAIMLLSGVVGSIIAGFLPDICANFTDSKIETLRMSLVVISGVSLLAFLLIPKIKELNRVHEKDIRLADIFKIKNPLLLFKITLPAFIVGMGAGMIIPFMNLYFKDRIKLEINQIGIIFSITQLFMFLGILLGPPLAKKFGKIRTVVITQFLSIPFMLILAFFNQYFLVALAFFMRAAFMNMAQPLTTAFAMELVPKNEQEITNSTLMVAWTFSLAISTAIGGKLIATSGFTIPLIIASGLYVLSSMFYFLFFFKTEKITRVVECSGN
ncbi:MFS transporter [Candidatus Dependentiae bacterium]|nr:MFS transporter [Candidatus Dependentiae bacterium]